jgi:hypothetical protein
MKLLQVLSDIGEIFYVLGDKLLNLSVSNIGLLIPKDREVLFNLEKVLDRLEAISKILDLI